MTLNGSKNLVSNLVCGSFVRRCPVVFYFFCFKLLQMVFFFFNFPFRHLTLFLPSFLPLKKIARFWLYLVCPRRVLSSHGFFKAWKMYALWFLTTWRNYLPSLSSDSAIDPLQKYDRDVTSTNDKKRPVSTSSVPIKEIKKISSVALYKYPSVA